MIRLKPKKKVVTFKRVVAVLALLVPIVVALIERGRNDYE